MTATAQISVARINGVALHPPGVLLPPEALRQRPAGGRDLGLDPGAGLRHRPRPARPSPATAR